MANLLFFSRVGFLFNLCYLAGLFFRLGLLNSDIILSPSIIIAGNILSVLFNLILFTGYLVSMIKKRNIKPVPLWLAIMNSLFLFIQLADLFL